jgi:hypothetical protein
MMLNNIKLKIRNPTLTFLRIKRSATALSMLSTEVNSKNTKQLEKKRRLLRESQILTIKEKKFDLLRKMKVFTLIRRADSILEDRVIGIRNLSIKRKE